MADSVHQKLDRVRKPRVHIKYEVETEGAVQQKELPFVVGVMGDFSGQSSEKPKPMKDRKFIQIDRDNFDQVMQRMKPGLQMKVDNTLDEEDPDSKLSVNLEFNSIEDFEPEQIVEQVPALKALKEARDKLRDLLTKSDRSDELETLLEETLKNTEQLEKLATELGIGKD